jgi:hypothetical protein
MSKKIWKKFPSIHDSTRAGENLQTCFIFALSRWKRREVRIGYRYIVAKTEIIVPTVTAPIKLWKTRWSGSTPEKKKNRTGTSISGMKEPTINPGRFSLLSIFESPHAIG